MRRFASRITSLLLLAACGGPPAPQPVVAPAPTAAEASAFIHAVDTKLRAVRLVENQAGWTAETNLTDATEAAAATAGEAVMTFLSQAIVDAQRFVPVLASLPADEQRMFKLLRQNGQPAPADPAQAAELARLSTEMSSLYGKGKACDAGGTCRDLEQLSDVMATSRKPDELLAAWTGWHDVGKTIAPAYDAFVPLANAGAQRAGFADTGDMWLGGYDMPADDMVAEADRLWGQLKPMYDQLHCYARRRLSDTYGEAVAPSSGPIPAHLLGNMWAQDWSNVYDLLEPYPGQGTIDVTPALVAQGYTPTRMTKLAEGFFTSLGMPALPATFYERSMLSKPVDREVVCHPSAWSLDYENDVRVKMCTKPNQEDLTVLHHELGHDYYFLAYNTLPTLFQDGANDGFHEAIGDTIALSVTPAYYKHVGLLDAVGTNDKALIDQQMMVALDKIAFLPFGLVLDKWRWEVFAGQVPRDQWNARWWELRRAYQGVVPPVPRAASDFDPAAKYHVASNTSYLRYFLATVLQFQFHRALCQTAGQTGPLHACSIFGSTAAGDKFWKMLGMGASKPWPDALEAVTGSRAMDATAIVDYFAPLMTWLEQQNRGAACGW